jgi:hypothetical protein
MPPWVEDGEELKMLNEGDDALSVRASVGVLLARASHVLGR